MNKHLVALKLVFLTLLINGCTFNFTIDTDYASQRDNGGPIEEEVTTNTTSETDPTVDASIPVEAL